MKVSYDLGWYKGESMACGFVLWELFPHIKSLFLFNV